MTYRCRRGAILNGRLGGAAAVLAATAIAGAAWLMVNGRSSPRQTAPPTAAREPRIVCLLPQATDIIEAIGCGDHLVGVANVDQDPAALGLPRVGDYQSTDWEAIAALHPKWIVTHYGAGRTPGGFVEHATAIGATQLNLLTETLSSDDANLTIWNAISTLGDACGEPAKATAAAQRLHQKLDAVHARVAAEQPVSALIIIGAEGTMAAGRESYLNELLELAGGHNAASELATRYPMLDREQIAAMRPSVILQLLPGASPQVCEQAKSFWKNMEQVPAVADGRVVLLTQWFELLPGYHVGEAAGQFADALHPPKSK